MASRRDFVVVSCGRLATALIAIVSIRIMTTLLSPADYGLYALLASFQTFAGSFLIGPVGQHINRHTHAWWDEGTLLRRLARYNQYILGVSLFISLPVVVWWLQSQANTGNDRLQHAITAGVSVSAIVFLGTWNLTLVPILNLLGFRIRSVVWTIIPLVTGILFSTLFVAKYHSAVAWIFGQAFGAALGGSCAWLFLKRYHKESVMPSNQSDVTVYLLDKQTIVKFCLPLAVATGFMWLQNTGYRFVVGDVWGVKELGILVVGLGISAQLWGIIESLAMQFLGPYLYRHITDAESDLQSGQVLSDYLNTLIPLYAVFAGFNAVCGAAVLSVLTDARYHVAAPFVLFGAIIEFTRATTNLWTNAAQAKRRTKGVMLPYGLGAAVVWVGAIGASHFNAGLTGLSIVLVVAGIVTCGSMIIIMKRLLPITINVPRLAIGLSVMVACFVIATIAPLKFAGHYQNIAFLLSGGLVAGLLITSLLWRNSSLTRLLSASLRPN